MEKITELKGQNGKLIVYSDGIVISRETFGGFISQGGASGERKYFYKGIDAIEYKKPSIWSNGYIKILTAGTIDTNAKVGLFGSSLKSAKDQNTLILRAWGKSFADETESVYNLIMKKISEAKQDTLNVSPSSKMDELKKLGDLKASGILTEEEFQREKERILNS
ncbi:SHOCT domain-containing protein [Riemerella anatipestifer]|uniref:SHOCT domain-containing protein n=1 Tax=Riemerella anatipestifer TaxID=34085 RepID=A0A1S7DVA9_RIEAN|nr:SHOCT domain-containing protein [Riemerella anatipestifer]AQY22991.1 hypothetical protein AB406_2051 [Riemerella anatipestifer]MBT0556831.1 SHOCT domain-containing protein [Riemerella anatipestifer]MCO7355754.1 SHOCT domain-containing protein [Riemerella anatipestifer]MDY3525063.1 SHOCT domain-containing protein [Riemerella anatipestifer]UZX27754.1 SHOCT domain-containing protein [Riemerella anatipestifer]